MSSYHRAAFLHIWAGRLTPEEIAGHAAMPPDSLLRHRLDPAFLSLVDSLKKDFSREFREALLKEDFSPEEYDSLAIIFCMLDEMGQMQIKSPLIKQLLDTAQCIKSRDVHGLEHDEDELLLFRRLFTFLVFTEQYISILTKKAVQLLEQVADDLVWPRFDPSHTQRRSLPGQPAHAGELRDKETRELEAFLKILSSTHTRQQEP
jgi:hypothetical protein